MSPFPPASTSPASRDHQIGETFAKQTHLESNLSLLQAQDSLDQELAAQASARSDPSTDRPVRLFGVWRPAERTAVAALWTLVSPRVAFRYLVVSTGIAIAALLATARSRLG
jgi:hypothetical protein